MAARELVGAAVPPYTRSPTLWARTLLGRRGARNGKASRRLSDVGGRKAGSVAASRLSRIRTLRCNSCARRNTLYTYTCRARGAHIHTNKHARTHAHCTDTIDVYARAMHTHTHHAHAHARTYIPHTHTRTHDSCPPPPGLSAQLLSTLTRYHSRSPSRFPPGRAGSQLPSASSCTAAS